MRAEEKRTWRVGIYSKWQLEGRKVQLYAAFLAAETCKLRSSPLRPDAFIAPALGRALCQLFRASSLVLMPSSRVAPAAN